MFVKIAVIHLPTKYQTAYMNVYQCIWQKCIWSPFLGADMFECVIKAVHNTSTWSSMGQIGNMCDSIILLIEIINTIVVLTFRMLCARYSQD